MQQIRYYVGLDLGSREHQVCLADSTGVVVDQARFDHTPEGLGTLLAWLAARAGPEPTAVAVALETPHGPVVEGLLEHRYAVFSINPRQVDRFRDRFTNAGAKNDAFDAHVMASSLRTDPAAFRRAGLPPAAILELREITRYQDFVKDTRKAVAGLFHQQLQSRFPALLSLSGKHVWGPTFLDLCSLLPSANDLGLNRLEALLRRRKVRRFNAQTAWNCLTHPGFPVPSGTEAVLDQIVPSTCQQLRLFNDIIRECDRRIASVLSRISDEQKQGGGAPARSDVEILQSCPGCGPFVLSRLLAEAYTLVQARDRVNLRLYAGVAPVTVATGLQCTRSRLHSRKPTVLMRRACNARLRNALYHWARVATVISPSFKQRYQACREKGKTHGHALRTLADRLLRIAFALLRDGTLYDPRSSSSSSLDPQ